MMLRNPAAVLLWLCCIFIVNSYGVDISVTFEDLEMDTAFSDAVNNPLNGQHLIVLPWAFPKVLLVNRNSSSYVINVSGPTNDILDHIAQIFHFTFEYYTDNDLPVELEVQESEKKPGLVQFFLKTPEADVIAGLFGFNERRNRLMDYTYAVAKTSMGVMIPNKPTIQDKSIANKIWKPFQLQVWLFLILSIVIGTSSLYGLGRCIFHCFKNGLENEGKTNTGYTRFGQVFEYIFSPLVGQQGKTIINNQRLIIRFLTGAWYLTCFVIVTAYCSVLVSFLTAPDSYRPIIESVNELPSKPEIRVTVNKGWIVDVISKSENSVGILKYIGEQLKHFPEQRCAATDQCVEQVRKGSSVYIFADAYILNTINEDWKKNGRCDFAMAKETFMLAFASGFFMKKNSPYTEYFNRGLMRIDESGLAKYWLGQVEAGLTHHCTKKIKREMDNTTGKNTKKPLTLKGLSGAFLVLGVGSSIAITAFIVELVHGYTKNIKIKPPKNKRQSSKLQATKIKKNRLNKNLVTAAPTVVDAADVLSR